MPYRLGPHDVQYVPLGNSPLGQTLTHALVPGLNSWPTGHVTHVVAVVAHVAQLAEHAWHTRLASAYVPAGHAATHAPALRYGRGPAAAHIVQALAEPPLQVRHVASHAVHCAPLE